jgi:hypothetical protein
VRNSLSACDFWYSSGFSAATSNTCASPQHIRPTGENAALPAPARRRSPAGTSWQPAGGKRTWVGGSNTRPALHTGYGRVSQRSTTRAGMTYSSFFGMHEWQNHLNRASVRQGCVGRNARTGCNRSRGGPKRMIWRFRSPKPRHTIDVCVRREKRERESDGRTAHWEFWASTLGAEFSVW